VTLVIVRVRIVMLSGIHGKLIARSGMLYIIPGPSSMVWRVVSGPALGSLATMHVFVVGHASLMHDA